MVGVGLAVGDEPGIVASVDKRQAARGEVFVAYRFVLSLQGPKFIAVVAIFAPDDWPQAASCVIGVGVQASRAWPQGWCGRVQSADRCRALAVKLARRQSHLTWLDKSTGGEPNLSAFQVTGRGLVSRAVRAVG